MEYAFIFVLLAALVYVTYILVKEWFDVRKERSREIWNPDAGWKSESDIYDILDQGDDNGDLS